MMINKDNIKIIRERFELVPFSINLVTDNYINWLRNENINKYFVFFHLCILLLADNLFHSCCCRWFDLYTKKYSKYKTPKYKTPFQTLFKKSQLFIIIINIGNKIIIIVVLLRLVILQEQQTL